MKMGHLGHLGHQYTHTYLEMSVCPKGGGTHFAYKVFVQKECPKWPITAET